MTMARLLWRNLWSIVGLCIGSLAVHMLFFNLRLMPNHRIIKSVPECVKTALSAENHKQNQRALQQCHESDLIEAVIRMNHLLLKPHIGQTSDGQLKKEVDEKNKEQQHSVNNIYLEASTVPASASKDCMTYHGIERGDSHGVGRVELINPNVCGGSSAVLVSLDSSSKKKKNVTSSSSSPLNKIIPNKNTNYDNATQAQPSPHQLVPNVVHYVYFGKSFELTFLNYLSLLSVHKFIEPDYIYIHGDVAPNGKWWEEAIANIPNIYRVKREMPQLIYGKKPISIEHCSDLARLQIIIEFGGIYLDWDVLALRSFAPLLHYELTVGRETASTIANGIMIARRGAAFLRVWLETYHDFRPKEWTYNSCLMSARLASLLPHLIHIEEKSLIEPSYTHLDLMFRGHYPWRENNYAMHIWARFAPVPTNETQLKTLNSTLGEVMSHVLYT